MRHFPFSQKFLKFRNEDKWYGNFLEEIPENPEKVDLMKNEPLD